MATKRQLDCRDVKRLLALLGFTRLPVRRGSHENFGMFARGRMRRVTVDCPKAPFSHGLVHNMAAQAGLTTAEFYAAADGGVPSGWPD